MNPDGFWKTVLRYPRTIIGFSVLMVLLTGAFLPALRWETSTHALIPDDAPVMRLRDRVVETFGLTDPLLVAVVRDGPRGVFTPRSLSVVSYLTREIKTVPGIDPERVRSLSTEYGITGTTRGIRFHNFMEQPPSTPAEAGAVEARVRKHPFYVGTLVSEDGTAALIAANYTREPTETNAHAEVRSIIDRAPPHDGRIYIAGQGAAIEVLSAHLNRDFFLLNPLVFLVIAVVLYAVYRTWRGVLLPLYVVFGAVVVTLGTMSLSGVPFYVITNAMTVLVVAIGIADGIHIISSYSRIARENPEANARECALGAVREQWRPVTLTSLTDMVGFLAISVSSFMVPLRWFGVFAALGVLVALLFSLFVVPSVLVLLPVRRGSIAGEDRDSAAGVGLVPAGVTGLLRSVRRMVMNRPGLILAGFLILLAVGSLAARSLEVNAAYVENNFPVDARFHRAFRELNDRFDGTNFMDVLVSSRKENGLLDPSNLRRIKRLQRRLERQEHVRGVTSVVDLLETMNRAMNGTQEGAPAVPSNRNLAAQYLLLYGSSANPNFLNRFIDHDHRQANLRVMLSSGYYTHEAAVLHRARRLARTVFEGSGLRAAFNGWATVHYRVGRDIFKSHFLGVGIALLVIVAAAAMFFSSPLRGLFAALPVVVAVLLTYGVMGVTGIWLSVGTSIFGALTIGFGVDFGIHTVERLGRTSAGVETVAERVRSYYDTTAGPLTYSALCTFLGFGVLYGSALPAVYQFGVLISLAVGISFLTGLLLVPALTLTVASVLEPTVNQPSGAPS